jgi:hypothetical protein
MDCDKLQFSAPGVCPSCGMNLIEKGTEPSAPDGPKGSVHFPDGKTSVTFPFELLANGVFVQVQVNHKGPLTFELDTGSFNSVVAAEIVGELGVPTSGTIQGMGSGTTFTASSLPKLEMVLPGGLVLSTSAGSAIPMAGLSSLIARRFDGVIGFDVLRQLIVKIDYAGQTVTLYDPEHFRYEGTGEILPFTLWSDYDPQVEGALSIPGLPPLPVRIVLDSGAGGTILTTPFVEAHRLKEAMNTLASPDVGAGGGESTKWVGRAASLRIGSQTILRPLVALSTDTMGSLAHADFDVNLGGNILRRFTVVIDYPGRRLMLEPSSGVHEPFASDASGLVLKAGGADDKTFTVTGVVPSSPAADAGIQVGDVISAVDGRPARQFALWELEDVLKVSNRRCKLSVQRGKTSLERTLKLRSLL